MAYIYDDHKTYEEYLESLGRVEIGDVYYFPLLAIGFGGKYIDGLCVVIGFDNTYGVSVTKRRTILVSERMTIVKEAEYTLLTRTSYKKVGHIETVNEVLCSLEDLKRGDV